LAVVILFQINTRRWGSSKGRGLGRTAFSTLKMATLLPIPSARVMTTMAVNDGRWENVRKA
jgi:hypothetical protein